MPRHCWTVSLKPSSAVPTTLVMSLSSRSPQPCWTNTGEAEQSIAGVPVVRLSQHTSRSPSPSATMRAFVQHDSPVGAPALPPLNIPSIATGVSSQQWPYESIECAELVHVLLMPSAELMHDSVPSRWMGVRVAKSAQLKG